MALNGEFESEEVVHSRCGPVVQPAVKALHRYSVTYLQQWDRHSGFW